MPKFDKFLEVLKMGEEPDNEDYLDEETEEVRPVARKSRNENNDSQEDKPAKKMPRISGIKTNKQRNNGGQEGMELCVIRPTTINDGREITETLLQNRAVVLNLEGLDTDIAQRIIDFTSGSCFAINGNMQKISHYIFVITPPTVDISGDFQDTIGGTESDLNTEFNIPNFQDNNI